MIAAVGVDVVQVDRIRRAVARWGDRLLDHVFTKGEQRDTRLPDASYRWPAVAGRFAAKEATKKILAARGHVAGWTEIEVARTSSGAPSLVLHGRARRAARRCGLGRLEVSISHERSVAVAVVLATGSGHAVDIEQGGPGMEARDTLMGVAAELGFDTSRMQDEVRLQEDLEVDSTELVEVAVALEQRLKIKIDSGRFLALRTVGDMVKFVDSALVAAGGREVRHAAHSA